MRLDEGGDHPAVSERPPDPMPCQGFAADIYDLYVLGLLEGKHRADLESHLARECEACVRNVKRSLDLWVLFASTLEDAEPSHDFRSRLVRIAELSKKILVFPRPASTPDRGRLTIHWGWIAVASALVVILVSGGWFAGHESGSIEAQHLSARLNELSHEAASQQVLLEEAVAKERELEKLATSAGNTTTVEENRRRILALEAEVSDYKSLLERQKDEVDTNARILNVLSQPGVRMVPLKGVEIAKSTPAYALVMEASRVVFFAANLPKLSGDKEFQLWLIRSQEPKVVSAGTFVADEQSRALVEFADPTEVSALTLIAVTDEPKGGSAEPTGTKLLVGIPNAE